MGVGEGRGSCAGQVQHSGFTRGGVRKWTAVVVSEHRGCMCRHWPLRLKTVKVVNFMSRVFCHNKNIGKTIISGC